MDEQVVLSPQPGRQELAMNIKADVIIYGGAAGSGKSRLLLMRPLQHIDDPNFTAVIFRRTQEALKKGGSVWPESKKLYRAFNTKVNENSRKHTFESGATIAFDGLQHVGDEESNYQGSQFSFIGFDEGTHYEECQVLYLLGRLRSDADNDSYCMISCNPDPDSWLLKWVEWYLDEEGSPIRERGGTIRYFITIDDSPVFANTEQELIDNYPEHCFVEDERGKKYKVISTYTFIDGTIYDNPALIKKEPKYLAKLKGQSRVNQLRLLRGNWLAREEGANYFQRDWLKKAKPPLGATTVRAYDKAASEPSEVYRNPDYTASIKISKDVNGFYYLQGSYHPMFKDDDSNILGKFRKRPGARDALILAQAKQDGDDVKIVMPQDPGAGGKAEFTQAASKLTSEGFIVKQDPTPIQRSKLKRFEPFASACENGLVFIDESSFGSRETLEAFYKELEAFDGERSSGTRHDDWADAVASGFNFIAKTITILPLKLPPSTPSRKKELLR